MTITFERPVGAPADVKELEYLSALHQSQRSSNGSGLRKNGTIQGKNETSIWTVVCMYALSLIILRCYNTWYTV